MNRNNGFPFHLATFVVILVTALLLIGSSYPCDAQPGSMSATGINVKVNASNGAFTITTTNPNWTFWGILEQPLTAVKNTDGFDRIGSYNEITFKFAADNKYEGSIRWYDGKGIVVFGLSVPDGAKHIGMDFPKFLRFPGGLHTYSFANQSFAPHQFKLIQSSTPWLFFNDQDKAFIVSPASDFIVSKMTGDGVHEIVSGLNPELKNLPAHFTHKTILAIGNGIHSTWTEWGNALMAMHGKTRPSNDVDPILKYYGYWTDNGADYYYNYEKSSGYAGTLRDIQQKYEQEGIPIRYMQLDSWWYEKSIYDPDGKPDAGHKNPNLPEGKWNRYGGLMEYKADPQLFPNGLKAFQQSVGLPLVVHNRWIDPHSPYHKKYDITGYAAIDPHFWNDIAQHLQNSGIVDYEQDWLVTIYNHTPAMASDLSVGNAFTDGMANACNDHGLDMQYCMAMPRFFMQGVKYNNLTTIRTSDDRFEQRKWSNFVYTSQLAYSLGIWPWCDVFKSHETGNMIVSVLSGGAVGTGDALGKEDKKNIMMASRTDGVLVKPDAALVPMDADYINDAEQTGKPTLAYTYTKSPSVTTWYVFAFKPNKKAGTAVNFSPASLGAKGEVVVYDPLTGSIKKMSADDTFNDTLGDSSYTYYEIAPVTSSGIALLGDEGKFVETGHQRIPDVELIDGKMKVSVEFAKGESSVTLHGYYEKPFKTDAGELALNSGSNMFTLTVSAPNKGNESTVVLSPE